ncbi:hypothetical protein JCM18916_2129 [Cutibacterium acnes JCM 18916]|nr:hypothetical protein JCM18916_2129 [Cutibacterium acnes JCM 18916]
MPGRAASSLIRALGIMSAIVVWLLTIYRVTPCVQHDVAKAVDPYQRQCYSDIPTLYRSSGMGHGGSLFANPDIAQTPLVTVLMHFAVEWCGLLVQRSPRRPRISKSWTPPMPTGEWPR